MAANITSLVLAAVVIIPIVARADGGTTRSFTGYAYDLVTSELVYRERHELKTSENEDLLRTVYECPEGRTLAVRQVDFGVDDLLPSYRIEDPRDGYLEGARTDRRNVVVFNREPRQGSADERRLDREQLMVADAGFDRFITQHWSELVAGERFEVDFLVPSRLRSLVFIISREEMGTLQGEPTVRFRMAPKNPILRLLVDPIYVSYHRDKRVLMRYEGLSNVRADDGDPFVVRIDFPIEERVG